MPINKTLAFTATALIITSLLPARAAEGMAILQESKPLVTRAGAWHSWGDRIHLRPGQEKLPIRITFTNGADGRPKATDLIVELNKTSLATFKDFKGGDSFTIDLTGKVQNNSALTVKGFGPSGARMNWKVFIQKPLVSNVNPPLIGVDDTIKISGENFSDKKNEVHVRIGKKQLELVSSKQDEILSKLPAHAGGGKQNLVVSVSNIESNPFEVSVRSNPQINWVDMLAAPPQAPVTIRGSGFSSKPEENVVTVGNVRAKVVSATEDSISFAIPEMHFPRWHAPIKVTTNGMPCKSRAYIHVDVRLVPNEGVPMR